MNKIMEKVSLISRVILFTILAYWIFLIIPRFFDQPVLMVYYKIGFVAPFLFEGFLVDYMFYIAIVCLVASIIVIRTAHKKKLLVISGVVGLIFSFFAIQITGVQADCRPKDFSYRGFLDKVSLSVKSLTAVNETLPSPADVISSIYNVKSSSVVTSGDPYLLFTVDGLSLPKTCDESLYKGEGTNQCQYMYQAKGNEVTILFKSANYKNKVYILSGILSPDKEVLTESYCDASNLKKCGGIPKSNGNPIPQFYCMTIPME